MNGIMSIIVNVLPFVLIPRRARTKGLEEAGLSKSKDFLKTCEIITD